MSPRSSRGHVTILRVMCDKQVQSSDRNEMAAVVVGAQRAWRGIVLRHVRGDNSLADDLLQRFALRALERLGDVRDRSCLHGWLRTVLASTLSDHAREAARRPEVATDPMHLAALPHKSEQEPEACPCLHPNMQLLRSDQADLLHRLDLAGERREAVAAALGLRMNTLEVRLHRARRALAARMASSCRSCREDGVMSCACPGPRPAPHPLSIT